MTFFNVQWLPDWVGCRDCCRNALNIFVSRVRNTPTIYVFSHRYVVRVKGSYFERILYCFPLVTNWLPLFCYNCREVGLQQIHFVQTKTWPIAGEHTVLLLDGKTTLSNSRWLADSVNTKDLLYNIHIFDCFCVRWIFFKFSINSDL